MMPYFREGSQDGPIWSMVFDKNEYRMPANMEGAVCLDVGAHIGSWSCLVKTRGASEVFAIEADQGNFQSLCKNFANAEGGGILQPWHGGAWRSDRRGARICFGGHNGNHTGNGWVLPYEEGKVEIPSVPFDDMVKIATDFGRRQLDFVKIDAEGAEWYCLHTSRLLHLINQITGEYHLGCPPTFTDAQNIDGYKYNIVGLAEHLEGAGFFVAIQPVGQLTYALFWAWRGSVSPSRQAGKAGGLITTT